MKGGGGGGGGLGKGLLAHHFGSEKCPYKIFSPGSYSLLWMLQHPSFSAPLNFKVLHSAYTLIL